MYWINNVQTLIAPSTAGLSITWQSHVKCLTSNISCSQKKCVLIESFREYVLIYIYFIFFAYVSMLDTNIHIKPHVFFQQKGSISSILRIYVGVGFFFENKISFFQMISKLDKAINKRVARGVWFSCHLCHTLSGLNFLGGGGNNTLLTMSGWTCTLERQQQIL